MQLSSDEIKYLNNYAMKLEKSSRNWKWVRVVSLFLVIFALIMIVIYNNYKEVFDLRSYIVPEDKYADMPINIEILQTYVDSSIDMTFMRIEALAKTMIITILASFYFAYCILNWRKDKKDILMARFIRKLIEDSKKAT